MVIKKEKTIREDYMNKMSNTRFEEKKQEAEMMQGSVSKC